MEAYIGVSIGVSRILHPQTHVEILFALLQNMYLQNNLQCSSNCTPSVPTSILLSVPPSLILFTDKSSYCRYFTTFHFVTRYTTLVPRSKNIRVPCLCFCRGLVCVPRINLLLVAHDQNHYSLSPFLCYNAKNHGQRMPCLWPPGWSCRSNVLFNGVEVMGAL